MITSKQSLIEYTLRRLGAPVVEVNVTDEQISDRLDDTIHKFQEFHYNGTQRVYLSHRVTATDIQNKYIPLPDTVVGVTRVLPFVAGSASGTTAGDAGLFSVQYQVRINDLWNINSGSAVYYEMLMQNLNMLDMMFNGQPLFRYTKVVDKLYIDSQWGSIIREGMYVVIEAFVTTDPEEYMKVWNEEWVRNYFAAQVKMQWGINMKKFQGVLMIGGVAIDGQGMYDEAMNEIEDLKQELREVYEEPCIFMVG